MNNIVMNLLTERFNFLCKTYIRLFGVNPLENTRRSIVVTARCIIANTLISEGWRAINIADVMHINHATICYYESKYYDIFRIPGYENDREVALIFKEKLS